jgi:hypothetical protein
MSRFFANLPNLVIANGATAVTTAITKGLDDARAITIQAPSALTGTITVQISTDAGTTWSDLTSGGSDVTIAAGNSLTITDPCFNALRVASGSAEGAERTFLVAKVVAA